MTALRDAAQQALECLKGVARGKYDGNAAGVCATLEAALAQPDEPVEPVPAAVVATQSDVWRGYNGQWAPPGEPIKMVQMLRDLPTGTLLYTTPPQRKPLTEEQISALLMQAAEQRLGALAFARAVERAHGIGGQE